MRRMIIPLIIAFLLASIAGFFFPESVQAHRMLIHYQVGRIDIKVYFEDGSPASNAPVKVYKPDGTLYVEGKTNEAGEFSFEPTVMKGDWKVVAEGVIGKAEASIKAWEGTAAHKMLISYRVGRIDTKVYFGGGTPAADAHVEVYKPDGTLYREGKTDDEGKFSFELGVMNGDWKVVAESIGHRQEISIDVRAESTEAQASHEEEEPAEAEGPAQMQAGTEMPLYTRIIAGFGYLIGLAGVAIAYMGWRARRNRKGD